MSAAEWQVLAQGLSEHVLHELSLILDGCEEMRVREAIVAEVVAAVGEFGDRAVIVGLARVSRSVDGCGVTGDAGGVS